MVYIPQTSIVATVPGSVATVIVAGSVLAILPTNQSVSGTINIGIIPGSVMAFQAGAWTHSVVGTVSVGNTPSVSGTVLIGNFPTNQSVSGTINIGTIPGSVIAFQGSGWSGSVAAAITNTPNVNIIGSIIAIVPPIVNQIITGSVFSLQAGTWASSLISGNASIITKSQDSSIIAIPTGSIITVFQNSSLFAVQAGTSASSVVSANPSSMLVGASIFGQLPAGTAVLGSVATLQGTNPWVMVGSVYGSGSVVAFQGSAPWANTNVGSIINLNIGSVITTNIGSTITVLQSSSMFSAQQGTWRVSVAGTYASGAPSVVTALGVLHHGVRNDTMASTLAADAQYSPMVVGPIGETIVSNAPITKWFQGNASIMTSAGGSVTLLAAPAAGNFNYITGLQFGGFGAQSVLLTISAGLGSTLGRYAIPPGGSQVTAFLPNAIKSGPATVITASIGGAGATTSSVFIGIQGFISTT